MSSWRRTDVPSTMREAWQQRTPEAQLPTAWEKGGELFALMSRDEIEPGDVRWHISVQHRERVPTWSEVAATGHELRPGVVFVLGVPPKSWWINVHPRVLHLWELRDRALCDQWRAERQGHTPS